MVFSLFSVIFIKCCEICGILNSSFLNGVCLKLYKVILVMVVILNLMVFCFGCLMKLDGSSRFIICVWLFFIDLVSVVILVMIDDIDVRLLFC